MQKNLRDLLEEFTSSNKFIGKGPLSVAIVITRRSKDYGLPLSPEDFITEGKGQVSGLGVSAVQSVLKEYGIERTLAAEGGRTSRNSLENMRKYVDFLNDLHKNGVFDQKETEKFWVEKVQAFFAGKPFSIKMDSSRSLRYIIRDLIEQATERQRTGQGVSYAGAVLQHLVGAKLDCALGEGNFNHNSFSTADAPGQRSGDFLVGDVAIHVTTSPGEAVIKQCKENLDNDLKPVLVTTRKGLAVAEGLAENQEIGQRVDIFEIEQFVALNVLEWAKFAAKGRRISIEKLVNRYNEIVYLHETDPSLRIEIKK
ncbi:MAG: DUF4928 family protein [Sphingomonadales bacterium]|nr:DUF4928 family protein [Sphingomonadales bacterium]